MDKSKRVVAMGFFDGVHLGHQALMHTARQRAGQLGATASVITFDAHPDQVVSGACVRLLGTLDQRKELIRRVGGVDDILVIHFDRQFMQTPWQDFARSLCSRFGAIHLVMGWDFSCGYRGEGTAERMMTWCAENGLGCDVVPKVVLDDVVVSSTYIRRQITAGDMERAARFLGHPYAMWDTVIHGHQRGRRMGIPTINFPVPEGVLEPRHGVYAARAWLPDGPHPAVTNVGVRPTFRESGPVTVETNLLDYDGELYGAQVRVDFLAFLRDERRFSSQGELAEQIRRDIEAARHYFRKEADAL